MALKSQNSCDEKAGRHWFLPPSKFVKDRFQNGESLFLNNTFSSSNILIFPNKIFRNTNSKVSLKRFFEERNF